MSNGTTAPVAKRRFGKRMVFGIVGAATAGIIGSAGLVAAQSASAMPQNKADCAQWKQFSFKNHGQCVSWWEHHGAGHGYGYGGNGNHNTVNTTVGVDVKGDNNVISIVINYFFGH